MSPTSRTPGRHLGGGSEVCPLLSAGSGETIVLWVLFCDLPKMFAFAMLHLLFSVARWSPAVPGKSPYPRSGGRTALRLPNGSLLGAAVPALVALAAAVPGEPLSATRWEQLP